MAKTQPIKTTVTNAKFVVEIFDGTNNLRMWLCEILDILSIGLDIALEEKPYKSWIIKNDQGSIVKLLVPFTYASLKLRSITL